MSYFSSSSFDVVTTATVTDVARADNAEALAKDGFKEEVADGTVGAYERFDALVLADGEGGLLLVNII